MQLIKIKMEIDTNPPKKFNTESKTLLLPIPFAVISYTKPNLFAGKLHAVLCRKWQKRIKGRDWYDLIWYIARNIPVNIIHLQERMQQSGHWQVEEALDLEKIKQLLAEKIALVDFEQAKQDIRPFIKQADTSLALWSKAFFMNVCERLEAVNG